MKRFIFDLDGTLLSGGYEKEEQYFKEVLKDDASKLTNILNRVLNEYENDYSKYDISTLSEYLTHSTGVKITDKIVEGWIDVNMQMTDKIEDGVIEVLDYLKYNNKSIVVLTNWFGSLQIERLKRANLYNYFDKIYTGDMYLKPHKSAYFNASGGYKPSECVVIGDTLNKDYIAPKCIGFDAVLYDRDDRYDKSLNKVKKLTEIINRY